MSSAKIIESVLNLKETWTVFYAGTNNGAHCHNDLQAATSLPATHSTCSCSLRTPRYILMHESIKTMHMFLFLVCTKMLNSVEWGAWGLDWVTDLLLCFKRLLYQWATFIVHNAEGFDSCLIFNSLTDLVLESFLIMQRSKILCFTDPISSKICRLPIISQHAS